MSTEVNVYEFKVVKYPKALGSNVYGVLLENGNPFAHVHYASDRNNKGLWFAFREGESKNYDIGDLTIIINKGKDLVDYKGIWDKYVTEVNAIVDQTIKLYHA